MILPTCLFCRIANGEVKSELVFEDEISLAFLDHRPVFHGHVLLVPKNHYDVLIDLPVGLVGPYFQNAQVLARSVETAMEAEGTFVAINNRISQSVPHLHVHIVPRRRKDGLKGFFWPRHKYESEHEMIETGRLIREAVKKVLNPEGSTGVQRTEFRKKF